MKRWWVRALLLAGIAAVAAAGTIAWRLRPRESIFLTNGDSIRELASVASVREILWEPPIPLDRHINTPSDVQAPADVYEPCISRDGQTLFFVRGRAGRNADLFECRRTFEGWTEPEAIEAVNSDYDELGPHPSPDGRSLYFYSDRPGGSGGFDLWCTKLEDDEWSPPVNLGRGVNSEFNEYGPSPSPDGRSLYFASNRPRPNERVAPQAGRWSATIREDQSHYDYDLFVAPIDEAGAGEAQPLVALNTPANEGAPCVSPFGDFLYFGSDRSGGQGGFDLYRARRIADRFEHATNLGPAVNTPANELDPALALGGFGLYFSSDRARDPAHPDAPGEYKLYYTASREVYRDVLVSRPTIDWRSLWRRLAPNLLWSLLALLAMLLLLAGIRDVQRRKLGLLTRCLLFSLFIHFLLMLLFNAWRVGSTLAQEVGRRGGIRVAFVSSSAGDSLAGQVRGNLTQIDPIAPKFAPVTKSGALDEPVTRAERVATAAPRTEVVNDPQPRPAVNLDDSPAPAVNHSRAVESRTAPEASLGLDVNLPHDEQPVAYGETNLPTVAPDTTQRGNRIALIAATQPIERVDLPPGSREGAPDQTVVSLGRPTDASPRSTASTLSSSSGAEAGVAPTPTSSILANLATPKETAPSATTTEDLPMAQPSTERAARGRATEGVDPPQLAHVDRLPTGGTALAGGGDASLVTASTGAARDATPIRTAPGFRVDVPTGSPSIATALRPLEESPHQGGGGAGGGGVAEVSLSAKPAPLGRAATGTGDLPESRGSSITSPLPAFGRGTGGQGGGSGEVGNGAGGGGAGGGDGTGDSLVHSNPTDAPTPGRPSDDLLTGLSQQTGSAPDALGLSLRVPTEHLAPENPYVQRAPEQREDLVRRMGGSDRTEAAVSRSLKWLARHQNSDGHWSSTGFDSECGECDGAAQIEADVAMTGLSVLCFLGADHTHAKDGPYRDNVRRAIRWLRKHQDPDGDLRNGESMYSHGIATIALAEAYGMTRDEQLHTAVRRATEFIWNARNRRGAGWRYEPGEFGDTSVLGWQVMALRSAKRAGVDVPDGAFEMAQHWLQLVSSRSRPGLYAYQPGRAVTPSMTAEGMFVLQITGVSRDDARMDAASALISRNRPDWDGGANTYYWYYATLALFQRQGDEWPRWNRRLVRELLAHQQKRGAAAGSWDPEGEWAPAAGRVYQTALCTLMLEVYYRYLPMYADGHATTQPAKD